MSASPVRARVTIFEHTLGVVSGAVPFRDLAVSVYGLRTYPIGSSVNIAASSSLLCAGRATTERDDVTIRVFNIEVFRSPRRVRQRLDNRRAIRDALIVERFDAVNARRRIEMFVLASVLSLGRVLRLLLQITSSPSRSPIA